MPTITSDSANAKRYAYLRSIADKLMTAPIEQLEVMYNETLRRVNTQPDVEIYPKLVGLLEQVAEQRFMTITEIDGTFKFSRYK